MNWQIVLQILSFLNVWNSVLSVSQRGSGDYVITDTRQIPNLNQNEKETLAQVISSLGGQDVEITVIDEGKSQSRQTFNQQQGVGYPNQGRPLIRSNKGTQIDVIDVYVNEPPSRNFSQMPDPPNYGPPSRRPQNPGPPPNRLPPPFPGPPNHRPQSRGPPPNRLPPPNRDSPNRRPQNRGPPPNRLPPPNRGPPPNRLPPPNRGPPPNRLPPRGPPNSGPPPLERYPPPQPEYTGRDRPPHTSFENDDYGQDRSHEHHHSHGKHHHGHRSNHQTRRRPPPRPIFDEEDPRSETINSKKTQEKNDFVYPESTSSKASTHRQNVDLSKSNESFKDGDNDSDHRDEEGEDYNVAGYINEFPVIFLNKNEIRK